MEVYGSIVCAISILTFVVVFVSSAEEEFLTIYIYNLIASIIMLIVGVIMLTK